MRVLNLYAGVGGNRMYWGDKHEITAVELNPSVAAAYADMYPKDTVIVGDAHQYLLEHYKDFDFIWASPPCQSHSRTRAMCIWKGQNKAVYPDMKLWQEIIFLRHFNKCDWVVENVKPYYKPFIPADFIIGNHLYCSNRMILDDKIKTNRAHHANIDVLQQRKGGIDLSKYKFTGIDKRQVLRNMVEPEDGKYVFEQITGEKIND